MLFCIRISFHWAAVGLSFSSRVGAFFSMREWLAYHPWHLHPQQEVSSWHFRFPNKWIQIDLVDPMIPRLGDFQKNKKKKADSILQVKVKGYWQFPINNDPLDL